MCKKIIVFLLLSLFCYLPSKAVFIKYTDVDTNICNINAPVKFLISIQKSSLSQIEYFHVAIYYGDGSSDTLTDSTNYLSYLVNFNYLHTYATAGAKTVSIFLYDSLNNKIDSSIKTYNAGGCIGKYSGIVHFDANNNCMWDNYEAALNNRHFEFLRNNQYLFYNLDSSGRFSLPLFAGDSITIPYASYDYPHAYTGGCLKPAITTNTLLDTIAVKTINVASPVYYTARPNICFSAALSSTLVSFTIPNSNNNVYKFRNTANVTWYTSSSSYPVDYYDYFSNGAGTYHYIYSVYEDDYYGPIMNVPITFYIDTCKDVIVKNYYEANNNCTLQSAENKVKNTQINFTSNLFTYSGGITDSNGEFSIRVYPGDTVKLNTYQSTSTLNGFSTLIIADSNCTTNYFTAADTIFLAAFAPKLIVGTPQIISNGYCINDTITYSTYLEAKGVLPTTSYTIIANYGDGIIDTLNYMWGNADTTSIVVNHIFNSSNLFNVQFTYIFASGQIDSNTIMTNVNDCKKIFIKIFNDKNNNCVQDAAEPFVTNFFVEENNNGFQYSSDTVTKSASCAMYQNSYINFASDVNQFGNGKYTKIYNTPICPWIDTYTAYQTYILPLNETTKYASFGNYLGACAAPFTVNNEYVEVNWDGNFSAKPIQIQLNLGDGTILSFDRLQSLFTSQINYLNYNHTYNSYGTFNKFITIIDSVSNIVVANPYINSKVKIFSTCSSLIGGFYNDSLNNCAYDATETFLPYQLSKIKYNFSDSSWRFSDITGRIYIDSLGNNQKLLIDSINYHGDSLVCVANPYTASTFNGTFLLPHTPSHVNDWGLLAAHSKYGNNQLDTFFVAIQNNHSSNAIGKLKMQYNAQQNFIWSSITPTTNSNQLAEWQLNVANGIPNIIKIVLYNNASSQNIFCTKFSLDTLSNEINISNNTFEICDSLNSTFGAYTINATSFNALPGGIVLANQPLVYKIEFTNTTGQNVTNLKIIDSLDNDFNLNTLQVLYASHKTQFYLSNNGVLAAESITLLPDINDDSALCKYVLIFSIEPNSNLNANTIVNNQALVIASDSLCFQNQTNITYNKMAVPNAIANDQVIQNEITIFPNPTSGILRINCLQALHDATVQLFSITGEKLLSINHQKGMHCSVDLEKYASGIYFIEVLDNGKKYYAKFCKQ
jgi:Secretion system C-terminal sorting domain